MVPLWPLLSGKPALWVSERLLLVGKLAVRVSEWSLRVTEQVLLAGKQTLRCSERLPLVPKQAVLAREPVLRLSKRRLRQQQRRF
jgi:hypothetical protein